MLVLAPPPPPPCSSWLTAPSRRRLIIHAPPPPPPPPSLSHPILSSVHISSPLLPPRHTLHFAMTDARAHTDSTSTCLPCPATDKRGICAEGKGKGNTGGERMEWTWADALLPICICERADIFLSVCSPRPRRRGAGPRDSRQVGGRMRLRCAATWAARAATSCVIPFIYMISTRALTICFPSLVAALGPDSARCDSVRADYGTGRWNRGGARFRYCSRAHSALSRLSAPILLGFYDTRIPSVLPPPPPRSRPYDFCLPPVSSLRPSLSSPSARTLLLRRRSLLGPFVLSSHPIPSHPPSSSCPPLHLYSSLSLTIASHPDSALRCDSAIRRLDDRRTQALSLRGYFVRVPTSTRNTRAWVRLQAVWDFSSPSPSPQTGLQARGLGLGPCLTRRKPFKRLYSSP
ncbi:hypothetical protein DFH09DRAFT_1336584 [Mycena vulgaris]|nr:hypothetical protein DFH09DRAFT_1336584 [Mycena vulgaris]